MAVSAIEVDAGGRPVKITNPGKVYALEAGYTKLHLVEYYLSVAAGALAAVRDRPMILKRFVKGTAEPPFFQKQAPPSFPSWVRNARLSFPSGRSADLCVVAIPAGLA